MKVLADKSKNIVALFFCRLNSSETKILCGAAFFRGGISGGISLFSETGQEFKIKIPPEVKDNNTTIINTNLEIELCQN
mgnify:CR=1 FL=1